MKDEHLTVRIPRDLARALARRARERGVPRSHIAREAVLRYLDSAESPASVAARTMSARELAARWGLLPRLTPDEAAGLARDVESARRELPAVRHPWE